MGLKKYEIITVGSDKRVRALRSWRVQDRYVNIGDVGGIVYDEKTLSQDGACWLFRGNFNFPGARIGGDSVVDVGEFTNANPKPNVTIDGSSQVVGTSLLFNTEVGVSPTVLNALYFEQGGINYTIGQKPTPNTSANYIRTKSPIFMGGSLAIAMAVPGYRVIAIVMNKDGNVTTTTANVASSVDVVLSVPTGQYCHLQVSKDPLAAIVPADATTAALTATLPLESSILIRDSRLELTDTGTVTQPHIINPAGNRQGGETEIVDSSVSIPKQGNAARTSYFVTKMNGSTMTADVTSFVLSFVGTYNNVKNIVASGSLNYRALPDAYTIIQATNCDNFAVSPTIFPGLAEAQTANMPFIFQGCNVPNGKFYHHAQIANTYKNVDFAKANADLGKATANVNVVLVSSEVEGMYRVYQKGAYLWGPLVESLDSVIAIKFLGDYPSKGYATTIYKDAYFNGEFDFAGTNVFGNAMKHEASNTQNVMAVQGDFNATSAGGTITGIVSSATLVCVPEPFRINGSKGLTIGNLPAGFGADIFLTDANSVIARVQSTTAVNTDLLAAGLVDCKAYIRFKKSSGDPITPEDVKGVTVTTYNGCKIVNTKATAAKIAGNVRVEDNATIIDTSVTGTGYFGGNAVMSGMGVRGYAYMKDNTLCTRTSEKVQTFASLVMEGNAVYNSNDSTGLMGLKVFMYDNSKMLGDLKASDPVFIMRDNATITADGSFVNWCLGYVTIKDNAVIKGPIGTVGDITICGGFSSVRGLTFFGKRTIADVNAPEYDDNVKTKYDF